MRYEIRDWTEKLRFDGIDFASYEDAEEFLCEVLDCYDDDRQEYCITEKGEKHA